MNRTPSAAELRRAKTPRNDPDRSISSESTEKLLMEIRDLLRRRVGSDEGPRDEDDKEMGMKDDWMLAAAVLNRICAVTFTAILVGGTMAFFVLFAVHP